MTAESLPAGACDCHMHVYDACFAALPNAIPRDAPVPAYRRMSAALGLDRMVVVQPSGYGFDNACTLDALAAFGAKARAVVVISPDTPQAELERLHALGVRGVRYMMVVPGGLGWDSMAAMAHKVAPLGWHLNLQFDGHQLPERLAALQALPIDLVIDHFGSFHGGVRVAAPGFGALLRLMDGGRAWVKLSGPYSYGMRGASAPGYDAVAPLARALIDAHPEHCLWASNWPHPTEATPPADADMLALLGQWAGRRATRDRILVDNPARLYGYLVPPTL